MFMFLTRPCEPIMHQVTLVCLVLTFMFCTHPSICASLGLLDGNLPGPNNAASIRCFHLVNRQTSSDWTAFPSLALAPPPHNPPTCGQVVMRPSQPDVPLWSVKQCGNHYTVQESSPSSRWLLLQFDKAASFSVASLICVNKSKASEAHEAKDGGTWSVYHAFKPWRTLERKIVSRGREKGHLAVRKCVHARNWGSSRRFLCMQSWSMFLKWTDLICCEFPGLMLKRNLFNLIKHHEIFCSRQQELWAFPQRWEEDSRCQR